MFPLLSVALGLALLAPAMLHILRELPRIQIVPTPWTPLPLGMISGYPGQ